MGQIVRRLDSGTKLAQCCAWRIPRAATVALLFLLSASVQQAGAAELQRETIDAFEKHVAAAEQNLDERMSEPRPLLTLSDTSNRIRRLRNGEILVGPNEGKGDISVPKGIVHHWSGEIFVPGRTIADALDLLRNYDKHKRVYPGSVEDSKTLSKNGNHYRAYLRLRSKRFVTIVLNTEHDAEFVQVDSRRWYSRSYSTRIAQVENAGTASESELPVGADSGYLWRIVIFWRFEEADGGVYLECEVLGLTRSVPYGLGWLVRPIIRNFPRESLTQTLSDTRKALLGEKSIVPSGVVAVAAAQSDHRLARSR